MEEMQLLEAVERYLRGEMSAEEKAYFDQLRRSNPEVDQLFVEQSIFFQQLNQFGDWKNYKSTLNEVHQQLLADGAIKESAPKAKVIDLWRKYKRVVAVAAVIAGITTFIVAGSVSYYSNKANRLQVEMLRREFKRDINATKNDLLNKVNDGKATKAPQNKAPKNGGTGFIIDGKGIIVTNAHVISNANTILVLNNKGDEFRANVIFEDQKSDIAILKIKDNDFKAFNAIPYSIKKAGAELGEQLFTIGYPRNEIVYNEGYMSAKTGFNGDTMSCQIGVPANPGNSGGPVFNKSGEIIGIINTRLTEAEGVVFAITSKNIYRALETLKEKDTAAKNIKVPVSNSIKKMDRMQQIKKLEDYVFMIKTY